MVGERGTLINGANKTLEMCKVGKRTNAPDPVPDSVLEISGERLLVSLAKQIRLVLASLQTNMTRFDKESRLTIVFY